jgi:Xaa-Pro aminopeptidase
MSRAAVAILLFAMTWARVPAARQNVPPADPAAYAADLAERRAKTAAALGPGTLLVLWSAPPRVYSGDMDYEYRQESNMLYLSGIEQPDTIFALRTDAPAADRASLFVRASDPFRELWEGHVLTVDEVSARSGVTAVTPEKAIEGFDRFVDRIFASPDRPSRLAVLASIDTTDTPPAPDEQPHLAWARSMARRYPGVEVVSAASALSAQRQIKTAYEQQILRRSVAISAEAHIAGMKAARPGRWEYEVEAAIEYAFHAAGALSPGYPSIVASGPNATTLHYEHSTRRMQAGDLLLVDAAGSYQGLTGDITRTYPVSGRFSPDQRALYEVVLEAQRAGLAAAAPGASPGDITKAVRRALGSALLALGLVVDPRASSGDSAQIDLWSPHGPVHGIGMDVHEPIDRLVPGVAFVIEPGIYVRSDTFARLSADPAQAAFARAIAPAVARFRDLGVRVEDSFLMTSAGPENLSAKAPRAVRDIEKLVGTSR